MPAGGLQLHACLANVGTGGLLQAGLRSSTSLRLIGRRPRCLLGFLHGGLHPGIAGPPHKPTSTYHCEAPKTQKGAAKQNLGTVEDTMRARPKTLALALLVLGLSSVCRASAPLMADYAPGLPEHSRKLLIEGLAAGVAQGSAACAWCAGLLFAGS